MIQEFYCNCSFFFVFFFKFCHQLLVYTVRMVVVVHNIFYAIIIFINFFKEFTA